MTTNGDLELYDLKYEHLVWKWKCNYTVTIVDDISEKLEPYLYDYDIEWIHLLGHTKPVFLTYGYEVNGTKQPIAETYKVPSQITCFTDPMLKDDIIKMNKILHANYIEKLEEYIINGGISNNFINR